MLKHELGALKGWMVEGKWLNGTCSMVQWSQPTPYRPLAQTSGHGVWPYLYWKQQQTLSIGLIGIAEADQEILIERKERFRQKMTIQVELLWHNNYNIIQISCDYEVIADTLHWTQMADGHLITFGTSDVTWYQKSTLVCTLNPELMSRSIVTDVHVHRFVKVTIYLGFAFILTIFDIFMLIIDY